LHRYSVNIILTIFKLISIMKKLILALAIAAFGASSTFAQAPATAPAAAVKAAPAAAAAATQAPAAAATEVKKVAKKAKKAHAAHAPAAAAGAKMAYQCPKGCALVDAPGKCPKCSTELVAIGGGAAKKAEKKAAAPAAAPTAAPEVKK
jgi:predicted Zn-ribbon and HTH transcriptional regulator